MSKSEKVCRVRSLYVKLGYVISATPCGSIIAVNSDNIVWLYRRGVKLCA